MRTTYLLTALLICTTAFCVSPPLEADDVPLDKLRLPDGFKIEVYADGVTNARSLDLSPNGTLFVSTRREGKVYAVVGNQADGQTVHVIAEDLQTPNGIAFRDGSLYVAEISRILRYDDIENRLTNPPDPVVVTDQFPTEGHHGWKYINFGPDGKLYVPVGAPCNICDRGDPYAAIHRMNPDGTDLEIYARGVRNSVGFDWHPETGELWFTDNGRDMLGDDLPSCELNHAPEPGMHFGYPYIHQGDLPDPEFGEGHSPDDYTAPALNVGPHVAPLGMEFYTGDQFPASYKNRIIVALHGSWNRSEKSGYKVMTVQLDDNGQVVAYEPFIEGWLQGQEDWGRPVDIEQLPDGSVLISDDKAGVIYRVSYEG